MQSGTPNPSADPRNPDPSAAVSRRVFDDKAIRRALMRISHEILERNEDPNGLYLVAIPNGGVPLARQLRANLGDIADVDAPLGILDTTLYRDDLSIRVNLDAAQGSVEVVRQTLRRLQSRLSIAIKDIRLPICEVAEHFLTLQQSYSPIINRYSTK